MRKLVNNVFDKWIYSATINLSILTKIKIPAFLKPQNWNTIKLTCNMRIHYNRIKDLST